jgi:hypothetical protein
MLNSRSQGGKALRGAFAIMAMSGAVVAFSSSRSSAAVVAASSTSHLVGASGTAAAAPTPDGQGFWTVSSRGVVSVQGDAVFYGDASQLNLNGSIVSIAPTFDGRGYWLLGSDGGVFSYGDASFHGSTGAQHLNRPVVGMARTPSGGGYWLVASDGGIFSFGNAAFQGSTGAQHLNLPVVAMSSTSDGGGYWLVASDGGIFAFGDAHFYGSATGTATPGRVVSIVTTGDGGGYWIISSDGNIYPYGDAVSGGGSGPPPPPSNVYLGEINALYPNTWNGHTQDSSHSVNGTIYTQSIDTGNWTDPSTSGFYNGYPMYIDYNLGRNYSTLNTTIGLDDNVSSSRALIQFQIFGDGVSLFSQNLQLGQAVPIHLNVKGVLRLRLQVTGLPVSNPQYADYPYFDAVFGSAYLAP